MRHITDVERRARLARRHCLLPDLRTDDVAAIADRLVAIHSSDPTTVFLTAAARMRNPSVEAIEDALYVTRSVLRHHAMRRTIWVMTPGIAQRAHASSTRKITTRETKRVLGWLEGAVPGDVAAWFASATERIVALVRERGAMTTRDVGRALPDIAAVKLRAGAGTRNETTVSAHSRLLMLAAFAGRLVRTSPVGSWTSSQYLWAPIEDWHLTDLDALDTDQASAALAEHYLSRFGPATELDITWWTGWTKTQVRRALEAAEAVDVTLDGGGRGWVSRSDVSDDEGEVSWVALLPGLDATTMGWKDRDFYLDPNVATRVFDRNGNAGPTIWMDGRVVGGWVQRPDGSIALDVPAGYPKSRRNELQAEISRLRDFVGDTRFRVRFPSPNQRTLLAPD